MQIIATSKIDPKTAIAAIGGFSRTSKMPCVSWGLPVSACHRGQELRSIEGTICSKCYAAKGRYAFNRKATERRLHALTNPHWVEAMIAAIPEHVTIATPYFRWFDSGDLQSYQHLVDINHIATALPDIKFWLPTQERNWVTRLREQETVAPNLTIRVSGVYINQEDAFPGPRSFVHDTDYTCPAPDQENKCGDCRQCWDPTVEKVIYKRH